MVLDFTSALYLGLDHGSRSLRPWTGLTTGIPAAMAPPPAARRIGDTLALLQGCEAGTVAPSTLHLFWDLCGLLGPGRNVIYVDDGVYPIGRWGVERAAARGVPVRVFPGRADVLKSLVEGSPFRGSRPIVVADGVSPQSGRPSPVAEYAAIVQKAGGRLVLDDTQALGVLGESPCVQAPYGRKGGGTCRNAGIGGRDIILIASLAKGFGAPLAVMSGCADFIERFERRSDTRVHCSPPSAAALNAAEHAMEQNRECGDALRRRLAGLVRLFRSTASGLGLRVRGGLFPVQSLAELPRPDVLALHGRLLRRGVRTVLRRSRRGSSGCISFILTARHSPADIYRAVEALSDAVAAGGMSVPAGSAPADRAPLRG